MSHATLLHNIRYGIEPATRIIKLLENSNADKHLFETVEKIILKIKEHEKLLTDGTEELKLLAKSDKNLTFRKITNLIQETEKKIKHTEDSLDVLIGDIEKEVATKGANFDKSTARWDFYGKVMFAISLPINVIEIIGNLSAKFPIILIEPKAFIAATIIGLLSFIIEIASVMFLFNLIIRITNRVIKTNSKLLLIMRLAMLVLLVIFAGIISYYVPYWMQANLFASIVKFVRNVLSLDPISLILAILAAFASLDALINLYERFQKLLKSVKNTYTSAGYKTGTS